MSRMDRVGSANSTATPAPAPRRRVGSFEVVAPPRRLFVPLVGVAPADVAPLAEGTPVNAGEPLTRTVPQTAPAALAPAGGVVAGVAKTSLADGRTVTAIVLETAAAAAADAPAPPTQMPAPDL